MPLGNSQSDERRHILAPADDRLLGAAGDRHEPLLRALAPEDQERLPDAQRAARQADQLGGAKAGAVEQFEKREVAQRQRLSARGAILGGFEQRRRPRSSPGSWATAARTPGAAARRTGRPCGCPLPCRKPKKRRSAADRRATVEGARSLHLPPSRAERFAVGAGRATRRALRRPARDRCDRRPACSGTRPPPPPSCRGTGRPARDLRGHASHVRASASAAIMRAV